MQTKSPRRPGEALFTCLLIAASLFLLYTAYGIAGFDALSSAGAIPMITTATMVICGLIILWQNLKQRPSETETIRHDILPVPVIVTMLAIIAYAILLKPLGFLPVSFLFLLGLIRFFSGRSLRFSLVASLVSVAAIFVVFRLIFSVLMPQGIIPEGEILAWISGLFAGTK